ncbi:hypothetical protein CALCODRAFT_497267 [Calocera cornea HHB12733]|uniref:Uncharacterized protein n=1 Tax=Calocera cornea HHB12733 TaxID=1353952 RepID=A0A165FBC1_9BASI|nr:hypothetical protein CALCODRAFT_497267 [Calocera cornea HHB12733]
MSNNCRLPVSLAGDSCEHAIIAWPSSAQHTLLVLACAWTEYRFLGEMAMARTYIPPVSVLLSSSLLPLSHFLSPTAAAASDALATKSTHSTAGSSSSLRSIDSVALLPSRSYLPLADTTELTVTFSQTPRDLNSWPLVGCICTSKTFR